MSRLDPVGTVEILIRRLANHAAGVVEHRMRPLPDGFVVPEAHRPVVGPHDLGEQRIAGGDRGPRGQTAGVRIVSARRLAELLAVRPWLGRARAVLPEWPGPSRRVSLLGSLLPQENESPGRLRAPP